MTPSDSSAPVEHRLHPLSILFILAAQLRAFAVPVIAVIAGAGIAGRGWEVWLLPAIVPLALISLSHYFTLRYRFEAHEMVIRSGLLFRNERHVPYDRVQNLDAVQNVFHRLLEVVEVRVETGGGQEPEAKMSVLSLAAFEEMRAHVLGERVAGALAAPRSGEAGTTGEPRAAEPVAARLPAAGLPAAAPAPAAATLLELPLREQLLSGLIDGRGGVLLAAGFGLLWELGLMERFTGDWFGDVSGRRFFRGLFGVIFGDGGLALLQVAQVAGVVVALLGVLRFSSMAWAVLRLHGFRLSRAGEDLRIEMGLLTRISATIPLRRIQTLTVREGPLHRLFGRVSVRVETAGGGGGGEEAKKAGAAAQREWLAPLLRREALPGLLRELLPDLDPAALAEPAWQGVHPRALRRELKGWLVVLPAALPGLAVGWWGPLILLPPLVLWAWMGARSTVARLGWAVTEGAVLFRSGWLWRRTSIVRFGKIQAVALHESPFDRRAAMARVRVDTAGAGESSHGVNIPYLARDTAQGLSRRLAVEAAGTSFRW